MNSKKIVGIFIVTALLFAIGIEISPIAAAKKETYYFFDRTGDHLLVSKDNDIYIRTLDGITRTRITESADVLEKDAFFSKDGRYVLFMVDKSRYFAGIADINIKYFAQPIDGDKTNRVEISEEIYRDFKKERITAYEKPGPKRE